MPSRKLAPLALLPLLVACGWIQLPDQSAHDFAVSNGALVLTPAQVGYISYNQLDYVSVPALPYSRVTIDASVGYSGTEPLRVQVYAADMRPACPEVDTQLEGYSSSLVCDGPAGGQLVAEVLVEPHKNTPLHLEGDVLARALLARTLYVGVRLLSGQLPRNEILNITQIKFHTWL